MFAVWSISVCTDILQYPAPQALQDPYSALRCAGSPAAVPGSIASYCPAYLVACQQYTYDWQPRPAVGQPAHMPLAPRESYGTMGTHASAW
jgi:hypothetical protein